MSALDANDENGTHGGRYGGAADHARTEVQIGKGTWNQIRALASRVREQNAAESLLREARTELAWWIDEHSCCKGHEGDLLTRIDVYLAEDGEDTNVEDSNVR